jgi:hypothetical protein
MGVVVQVPLHCSQRRSIVCVPHLSHQQHCISNKLCYTAVWDFCHSHYGSTCELQNERSTTMDSWWCSTCKTILLEFRHLLQWDCHLIQMWFKCKNKYCVADFYGRECGPSFENKCKFTLYPYWLSNEDIFIRVWTKTKPNIVVFFYFLHNWKYCCQFIKPHVFFVAVHFDMQYTHLSFKLSRRSSEC